MKRFILSALSAAMTCAPPLQAATITQTTSDFDQNSIAKFDPTLGTLTSVTVQADVAKYAMIVFDNPLTVSDTINWTVAWSYSFGFTGEGDSKQPYGGSYLGVALVGSGAFSIPPGETLIEDYVLGGSGLQTFELDPEWFIDEVGGATFFGHGGWFQHANPLNGFSFTSQNETTAKALTSMAEDFNGRSNFEVTYTFTPAGAVPEPATWAMLILGFGAVGGTMRRRSATAKASRIRLTYA